MSRTKNAENKQSVVWSAAADYGLSKRHDSIDAYCSKRIRELEKIISVKEKAVSAAPPGSLKIQKKGNCLYYLQVIKGEKISSFYLNKSKSDLICQLAQKSYDKKVLKAARGELEATRFFLCSFPIIPAEEVYECYSSNRKELIEPIQLPADQMIRQWLEAAFLPKSFPDDYPEYYTENGERVRSKSEVIIANLLKQKNIPYKYECPLVFPSGKTIYPDFTILDIHRRRQFFLEHLGMMDDPLYSEVAVERISLYEENGIFPGDQLIITHETRRRPLNIKAAERVFEHYLSL